MRSQRNRTSRYHPPPLPRFAASRAYAVQARFSRASLEPLLWITGLAVAMALLVAMLSASPVWAQQGIYATGDAIVTGFSGVTPPQGALPAGRNPTDETFIDLNGDSMKIFHRPSPPTLDAQLLQEPPIFTVKARDVGQVFAIALEDRDNGQPPNIYLGATSSFGIQIVKPDDDRDGRPERIMRGAPGAAFMAGQFGAAKGGGPGAIWRVDGQTGAVTLFANLPNSGPGIGDIVYDSTTRQFFASDLDGGLIHRIGASGAVLDSFDHGTMARPMVGLGPVPDNGARMDIASPAFDPHDAMTWGFSQPERLVWGMAARGGRLYYAVTEGVEIWSIGILLDGGFANDARLEFPARTLTSQPISDMAFDAGGRLYLTQREPRGNYNYVLATRAQGRVQRYRREFPDDPGTRGTWISQPEEYAIGLSGGHWGPTGGLALGYGANGGCGERLWFTGDDLHGRRDEPHVDGLQVNPIEQVRLLPGNKPPAQSFFLDYDGQTGAGGNTGHVGDVEIWQSCRGQTGYSIAPYGELPAGYAPPAYDAFNLRLTKRALPRDCTAASGGGFHCDYTVRVTNTGPGAYLGPVTVYDLLPGAPGGAVMRFDAQPSWNCTTLAAHEHECAYPPVLLFPGDTVELAVTVKLPARFPQCRLENVAALSWPFGSGDANPDDDIDWAHARVPSRSCPPAQGRRTNLLIDKDAAPPSCWTVPGGFRCSYLVKVTNAGPGVYNGRIQVTDTVPAGSAAAFSGAMWNCTGGPAYACTHSPATLNPGDSVFLPVRIDIGQAPARALGCRLRNRAKITGAVGGSDQNTDPADDEDEAVAVVGGRECGRPRTNLRLEKTIDDNGCQKGAGHFQCYYNVRVTNTGPGPYSGLVTLRDTIPEGATAIFAGGWTCLDANPQYTCSKNVNLPNPGDAAIMSVQVDIPDDMVMRLECKALNQARILFAPSGSSKNTDKGDDQASAAAGLPAELCGDISPPREQACPSAYRWDGERCVRGVTLLPMPRDGCRRGFWRTQDHCCPLGQAWDGKRCGAPTQERPECPHGVTGVYPDCVLAAVRRCPPGFSGRPPVCCPPSTRFRDGRCVKRDEAEDSRCGRGQYMSEGHCCPRGTVWNGKRCLRNPGLQPSCPPGTTGSFPNCRTLTGRTCPPGTTGRFPDCAPLRTCPAGTVGAYPNCRPFQAERCPPGTRGAYPNCIPTARNCPPGTFGVPPICRSRDGRPCPPGTVGSAGRCLQLQQRRPVPQLRQPNPIELQRQRARPPGSQFRPTPRPILR